MADDIARSATKLPFNDLHWYANINEYDLCDHVNGPINFAKLPYLDDEVDKLRNRDRFAGTECSIHLFYFRQRIRNLKETVETIVNQWNWENEKFGLSPEYVVAAEVLGRRVMQEFRDTQGMCMRISSLLNPRVPKITF